MRGGRLVRDCSCDVYEKGRRWATGRESLKGMVSVGWQDGRREWGRSATAERGKCGRTNWRWLTGSFIHHCDQIQQDSPPYGMAQLIHPISWTTHSNRRGKGCCVCVCVCVWRRRCLNITVNERGSEEKTARIRGLINLLYSQHKRANRRKRVLLSQGGGAVKWNTVLHDFFVMEFPKLNVHLNNCTHSSLCGYFDDFVKTSFTKLYPIYIKLLSYKPNQFWFAI